MIIVIIAREDEKNHEKLRKIEKMYHKRLSQIIESMIHGSKETKRMEERGRGGERE